MRLPTLPALLAGAALALAPLLSHAQDAKPPAKAEEAKPGDAKADPAQPEAPGPGQEPDPKILQSIAECLAEGLPENWQRTWFEIREIKRDATGKDRQYEALFFYATDPKDRKGRKLQPCGAEQIVRGVGELNNYLPADQQRWTAATFSFDRDGKFEAKYDYTPPKPPAKAAGKAPRPAAKKKADGKS